jgi:hypothetical protein
MDMSDIAKADHSLGSRLGLGDIESVAGGSPDKLRKISSLPSLPSLAAF